MGGQRTEDGGQRTGRGEEQRSHPERNMAVKKMGFLPPRELFQAPGEIPGPPGAPIFRVGFCGNFYSSFLGGAVRVAGVGEEARRWPAERKPLAPHGKGARRQREVGKLRGKGLEEPGAAGLMVPFLQEQSHTPLHE